MVKAWPRKQAKRRHPRRKPVIAVLTVHEEASWGGREHASGVAHLLPAAYTRAVVEAGGTPMIVPLTGDHGQIAQLLDDADGVMLAGGADVDPALYGQQPHPTTNVRLTPEQERAMAFAARHARERGKPFLAICRGMQATWIAHQGKLHQHLPDVVGHDGFRTGDGPAARDVVWKAGSLPARLLGAESTHLYTNHQGLDLSDDGWSPLADGLEIVGWDRETGLPVAFVDPRHPYYLAVQYHPEKGVARGSADDLRLFTAFVETAARLSNVVDPTAARPVAIIEGDPAPTDRVPSRRRGGRADASTTPPTVGTRRTRAP